MLSAYVI